MVYGILTQAGKVLFKKGVEIPPADDTPVWHIIGAFKIMFYECDFTSISVLRIFTVVLQLTAG